MAFVIRRRAIVAAAVSATALSGAGMRAARAQAKTGLGVYPVAVPTYQVQFVAQEKGFFRDEGYEFKLVQGGSGVKTREILASRQADFAIADILHVLQLNKNGRPTREVNAGGGMYAVPYLVTFGLSHAIESIAGEVLHGETLR